MSSLVICLHGRHPRLCISTVFIWHLFSPVCKAGAIEGHITLDCATVTYNSSQTIFCIPGKASLLVTVLDTRYLYVGVFTSSQ